MTNIQEAVALEDQDQFEYPELMFVVVSHSH
jgi:hypothetical protein